MASSSDAVAAVVEHHVPQAEVATQARDWAKSVGRRALCHINNDKNQTQNDENHTKNAKTH